MKEIIEKLEITQAVCESKNSDKIIRYMRDEDLSRDFIREYQNGNVYGVYEDEDGDLFYTTNDGEDFLITPENVLEYTVILQSDSDSYDKGTRYDSVEAAERYISENNGKTSEFSGFYGGIAEIYCPLLDKTVKEIMIIPFCEA